VLSLAWRNSGAAACLAVASDTHGVSEPASYAVVVLAGGSSRRMGGGDKTALDLGTGQTVLGHLVSSLDTSVPVVVVGPERPLERSVRWARESPPGGGPVAGLAAGLGALRSDGAEWVVVIAGDQPFAAAAVSVLLAGRAADVAGVVGVDTDGRDQPLLGAYRVAALSSLLGAATESLAGRSVRSLVEQLTVRRVALPELSTLDVDDEAALAAARAALRDAATGSRSSAGPAENEPRPTRPAR
jgi:molybdopterin-guanine dinucleotide biosynthesis protein A